MDREFVRRGTTFRWNERKAAENRRKHAVAFEEAVTVFEDPFFVLRDGARNGEQREIAIGFSAAGRLLTVVHVKDVEDDVIRNISAWRSSAAEQTLYDQ